MVLKYFSRLGLRHKQKDGLRPEKKDELNAGDIFKGFEFISDYLCKEQVNLRWAEPIKVFVAGDAVSVCLGNRDTTKAIDLYTDTFTQLELASVVDMAPYILTHYPSNWIKLRTLDSPDDTRGREAMSTSTEMLYSSKSLQVYILDWKYQLVDKIQLVKKHLDLDGPKDLDGAIGRHLSDAVYILNLIILKGNGDRSRDLVHAWCFYGPGLEDVIIAFDKAYRGVFKEAGIRS